MSTRSNKSMVTFCRPFTLSGSPDKFPAGDYEVLVEEELLQGLSFLAYRKTATYLVIARQGRTEMHQLSSEELEALLSHDKDTSGDF